MPKFDRRAECYQIKPASKLLVAQGIHPDRLLWIFEWLSIELVDELMK